jgi:hypothetical protein
MGSIFGESKQEKEEFNIIERLLSIIENLTRPAHKPPKATALKANYITVDKSGNLIFNNSTTNSMAAQNVTVSSSQNSVPGQIVPVAADLVTVLPISSIQPGSETYSVVDQATGATSTIATATAVPGGSEGQYTVNRISGQGGVVLVSYNALAADGVTKLTNAPATPGGAPVPDVITFQGTGTGTGSTVAAALTATYGTPS